ncbi:hypothetical protein MASR1M59_12530 [Melaminivora sp.]
MSPVEPAWPPTAPAPAAGASLQAELAQAHQQLDDLRQAQQAFVRRVVHDLRAPLRHVTSYGVLVRELLQELPEPPEQVVEALDCVATMEQSARRMADMLDALRALQQAESQPLQCAAIDPLALLRPCAELLTLRAAAAQSAGPATGSIASPPRQVHWQFDPAMPALWADAQALRSLLEQLLDNALKFTRDQPDTRISVSARLIEPAQPSGAGARVRLCLQDNGAGFDPERAPALFGLFERLHSESQFPGLGCGLALCRVLAERHGAHIRASARPGQGCLVELDWPAAPTPPAQPVPPAQS